MTEKEETKEAEPVTEEKIVEPTPKPAKEESKEETSEPTPEPPAIEPAAAPEMPDLSPKPDAFADEEKQDAPSMPVIKTSVEAKQALPAIKGAREVEEEVEEETPEEVDEEDIPEVAREAHIFALRTTANREDQVLAFVGSNAARKKLGVYSAIAPHGMRGYIFLEAVDRHEAEQAAYGVPYAKGLLPNEIEYEEIEHMLEQVKKDINIQKNDIAEILSGPFKREKAKIARVDKAKEEVVVELLEAAVPIPITLKIDSVKVIRRDEK
ncbi:transcription elongation factor Spt5 [Candidatus Woesearchaeota archaeon]|nr:transcription elongation factor Spt5 [Candidatus Woesearchaeota archaeon]